jgi:hypothetical protein
LFLICWAITNETPKTNKDNKITYFNIPINE